VKEIILKNLKIIGITIIKTIGLLVVLSGLSVIAALAFLGLSIITLIYSIMGVDIKKRETSSSLSSI